MAAKHTFSIAKSIWMQINWNFGLNKNIVLKTVKFLKNGEKLTEMEHKV
jgi:hypothetical protein